jgi:phosphate uptake regulator
MGRKKIPEIPKISENDTYSHISENLLTLDTKATILKAELERVNAESANETRQYFDNIDLLDKKTWDSRENIEKLYFLLLRKFTQRYPEATSYSEAEVRESIFELLGSSRDSDRIKGHLIERMREERLIEFIDGYKLVFITVQNIGSTAMYPKYEDIA